MLKRRLVQVGLPIVALLGLGAVVLSQQALESAAPEAVKSTCTGRTSASIGGAFDLIDQNGNKFTNQDLLGQPSILYFGFTYCPDICPMSLQIIEQALKVAGPSAARIQPVLITIDPERDTPEALKQYVASSGFPRDMIGLTGSPEQIEAVAEAFKVGYQKVEMPESSAEYLMDHSSIIYLMDSKGALATFFSNNPDPEEMGQCIAHLAEAGL